MTTSIKTLLLLSAACWHAEVLTVLNRVAEAAGGKARLERMKKVVGG